jgi:acetyltransferase-like isoleucine patch superfamily enzyme
MGQSFRKQTSMRAFTRARKRSPAIATKPRFYAHPLALIDKGAKIGPRTRVWAFAHLMPGVTVGTDCNIYDHTLIETGVRLGNRVTVKSGVFLWDGIIIDDDVFIGPAAVFTNDPVPRSRRYLGSHPKSRLRRGCSIGAGAIILPGVTIGRYAMVGAGAVVTREVSDYSLVYGNPARWRGWVCACGDRLKMIGENIVACQCGHRAAISRRQRSEHDMIAGHAS